MRRIPALALALWMAPWAALGAWTTPRYEVTLKVMEEGALQVTEEIDADFREESHHGIYRDIPLSILDAASGRSRSLRLRLLFVDDGAGHSQPFQERRSSGWYHLRIGDPSVTYREVRKYRIAYEVRDWCLSFDDHQELYWNAIGADWLAPIGKASAWVILPKALEAGSLQTEAYTGSFGSREREADIHPSDGILEVRVRRPLGSREGLTLRTSWPGHPVPVPSSLRRCLWFLGDHPLLFLPVLVFLFMFTAWWKKGRDPGDRSSITVQYHPPEGLTSMTAGALIDESCDMRDITAGIIELAVRGYLKIVEKEQKVLFLSHEDYSFERTPDRDRAQLPQDLGTLYDAIFSYGPKVGLSDMDRTFYVHLKGIRSKVYGELVRKGLMTDDPEDVRARYFLLAVLVLAAGGLGLYLKGISASAPVDPWDLAFAALGPLLTAAFGYFMPARTLQGVQAREELLGLEEYIKRAEAENLKYDEKKNVFEEILPYAMALGLSSKWSKAFSGAFKEPPSWYYGPTPMGGWNPYSFERSLSRACSSFGNSMVSAPRSSGGGFGGGGGFSGGGGGGGGGGAW